MNTVLTQPLSVVTVRVTLYVPVAAKTCVGFCNVEVLFAPLAGSSKFHCQFVTAPAFAIERSLNDTDLVTQVGAAALKSEVGNGFTVTLTEPVCAWLHCVALPS